MRRLLLLAAALIVCQSVGAVQAQLIQIRPGYVRAPFVRVHKYPDGSSYVRAPFVSVHSRGRGRYRRAEVLPHEVLPPGHDIGQSNWRSLRHTVRQSAADLEARLQRFPTGAYWMGYLRTVDIRNAVSSEFDGPPTDSERETLQEIRDTFDRVSEAPELASIINLVSFQTLYAALDEFLSPVDQRLRLQLLAASEQLDRELAGRFSNPAGWQDYLALPPEVISTDEAGQQTVTSQQTKLVKLLDRFESISQDATYHRVTQLPGFAATLQRLAEYLQHIEGRELPDSQSEELPPPSPPPVPTPPQ